MVANSPDMGLRARLPEKYHLKNFTKLALCGLIYHGTSLSTEEEGTAFKEYKVSGVREHIPDASGKATVESIVKLLPLPDITCLATLALQHLSLY
jgi:hypothetical protein